MKNRKIKIMVLGIALVLCLHFVFISINPTMALPEDDFLVNVGDVYGLNRTFHIDSSQINSTINIEILEMNYSYFPYAFGVNGSAVWVNVKAYNGTGDLDYDLDNWTVCYNETDPTIAWLNGCVPNPNFDDSLFVAPANLTAYLNLFILIFSYNLGMNTTTNDTFAIGWQGFDNGSGYDAESQKWIIGYNGTDHVMEVQEIWLWNNVTNEWELGTHAERYYTEYAESPADTPIQSNPVMNTLFIVTTVVVATAIIGFAIGNRAGLSKISTWGFKLQ